MRYVRFFLVDCAIIVYTAIFASLAILLCWVPRAPDYVAWIWAQLILHTSEVTVEAEGVENITSRTPYVFMSNHMSHFDVLSLVTVLPFGLRFLAKKELARIPVLGWAMYAMGQIIIDRANQAESFKSIDKGARRVRNGVSVLVFVEGTRSPDGSLQAFKKGGFVLAIKAGVDIVPISISGSRSILPKGSLRVNRGRIRVALGRPIATAGFSVDTKEELMARVRTAIERGLIPPRTGVPRYEKSLDNP